MSDQTTNPTQGESSLSIDQAATAIHELFSPKESKKEQPSEEPSAEVASEDSSTEAPEAVEEESQDQPTATEEGELTDEDEFLIGEEKVKASQLREWKEAGLRLQDYTKKTQELAQARKEWEAQRQHEEQQFHQQWQERLSQFADVVVNELKPFENMDWDKLRNEDPYQYQIQWADYQRASLRAQHAQQVIGKEAQERQQQMDAERKQLLQAQANEAKKLLPDLADPVKAEALVGKMTSYLKGIGFSPDEMASITDAKALKVIHDAMQWQDLRSGAKAASGKKVVPVTKVVKPGAPQTNREVRSERSMKREKELGSRLRKTGRIDDAAAIIAQRMR